MTTATLPRPFEIRPAHALEAAAIGIFGQGLSARSKRLRFHGAISGASPALQKLLCDVDGVRHHVWLAWAAPCHRAPCTCA